jgi:hypothetical protein
MPFVALTDFDDVIFDISDCGIEASTFLYKKKLNGKILLKSICNAIGHQQLISQLQNQKLELERSNKDLEKFSYAVSHDLREPLRSISGFIQLLSKRYRGALDANADHYIERLNSAASRMQDMITSILDYSKISTKAEPFKLVDCNEILENSLKNVEVAIFQNLIANSVKFSSKDKNIPEIHIGVDKSADFYEFYVKDNGIGIDSKYFERIFIIFQRLHNDAVYRGYGVGLAICKKIVERHGGAMRVSSTPGMGSTFYFTIPVKRKETVNVN